MKQKKILLIVLVILLVVETGVLAILSFGDKDVTAENTEPVAVETTVPTDTVAATDDVTEPSETILPTETDEPTEPTETEPAQTTYTLSFAGDCTFGSLSKNWNNKNHFIQTIGENYDYPFANVREYFENDDFTIINLEGPLTDSKTGAQSKTFAFRGPTAYTRIMTGSSVEAVSLANNHAEDYGKAGYESTTKVLGEAGITYVEKNKTALYTTDSGLTIGMYAAAFSFDKKDMKADIEQLRKDGAEIVICAFHWGNEGEYRPTADQQKTAKAAIDAGADIVYGHHPHVLQKIEQYNDGYIFYSLGNFSFGGAALPGDFDTALLQLDVVRDENGGVDLGELTIIPCTYRAADGRNSFQPTPLEEGTKEYNRVMSKLDGSFKGPNLNVNYEKPEATNPPATNPPATNPPAGGDSGNGDTGSGDSGGSDTPVDPPAGGDADGGNTPVDPPAGGDAGSGGGSGGDAGNSGGNSGGGGSGGDAGSGGGNSGGGDTGSGGGNSGSGDSSGGSSGGGEASGGENPA